MTLKNATTFAIAGVIVEICWDILSWVNNLVDLISYQNAKWFYQIWIVPFLFFLISLLVFFITLSKKQQGGNNG